MNWPVETGALRRAKIFTQLTMDALPLAVCILDAAGNVVADNDLFRSLAAKSPLHQQVVIGKNYFKAIGDAGCTDVALAVFIAEVRDVLRGTKDNIVHEYACHGFERPRWFEARAVRLPGDAEGRVLVSHVEITARREAQQQLQALNADLEQSVQQRMAGMQQTIDGLESFNHTVAHDLRSSLLAVEAFVRGLQRSHTAELSRGAAEKLTSIAHAMNQVSEMLDGLLALSRSVQGTLPLDSVDITAMARGIGDELTRSHPGRTVTMQVADMPKLETDPRLMRVALRNLMENAWKYTARTSAALVEVGCLNDGMRGANSAVTYFVRDNGVGFPAQESEQAFLPFKRLSTSGGFPGAGMGLATVKRIIDRLGGQVWAESEPGKGATLFFALG
jgi:signal transduction histidine kinase